MTDPKTGPALAAALEDLHPGCGAIVRGPDDRCTRGEVRGVPVYLHAHPDHEDARRYQYEPEGPPGCGVRTWGYGPTPEAAREDALRRLHEGYTAVRDVLDPNRRRAESVVCPACEDGTDGDGDNCPCCYGKGRVSAEDVARIWALRLGTPPERGTKAVSGESRCRAWSIASGRRSRIGPPPASPSPRR